MNRGCDVIGQDAALIELDLFDVVTRGFTVDRELATDYLHDLGMATLGELVGCFAHVKARGVENRALNELVCLQRGVSLLDRAVVNIGFANDDDRIEVMGQAAELPDIFTGERHGSTRFLKVRNAALNATTIPYGRARRQGRARFHRFPPWFEVVGHAGLGVRLL